MCKFAGLRDLSCEKPGGVLDMFVECGAGYGHKHVVSQKNKKGGCSATESESGFRVKVRLGGYENQSQFGLN